MEPLSQLALFLAVAEDRSFSAAARRLGLSPSATGKAVQRLETRLGVRLFQRTTRRVRLTDAGDILFERARAMRDEWQAAQALLAATRAAPSGRLRVALPAIGHRLLAPHLADFLTRYPALSLDLDQDDRLADLTAAGIDVAIRSGVSEDSSHRSRPLTGFRFLLCASPDYARRHGLPTQRAELAQHAQIRFRHGGTERLQPWRLRGVEDAAAGNPRLVCTQMEAVLAAARQGLGIAQLPSFLAREDLAGGHLVSLLDDEAPGGQFHLLWPHHLHRAPKLRAFVDFFVDRLSPADPPLP